MKTRPGAKVASLVARNAKRQVYASHRLVLAALAWGCLCRTASSADEPVVHQPLFQVADLNTGESQVINLSDGKKVTLKLLGVEETRDNLRSAIRLARVKVEVNGAVATIESGNYRLPVTIGDVQIDCPATQGLYWRRDLFEDSWGLDKAARLRLWPKGSPWMEPGTFGYPIRQRWFANVTQAGNEPSYVMGDDAPTSRNIYYHSGNDIGGVEGTDQVIAASDGLVISARGKTLAEYPDLPFYQQSSYATVYVVDAHGWIYRYTHLKSVDPSVKLGERIAIGQNVGLLGKEEGAGYYAHLHFDIKSRKPSGRWGVEDAYAFLWEAYQREYKPAIIAVARPHHLTRVGDPVTLDGSRSWSAAGDISRYEWTFGDGGTASGSRVERKYHQPGRYSEILTVTDREGHVDYDFAIVDVIERERGDKPAPGIHAACHPSQNIRPGDPVTFVVRTAGTVPSGETWDFGDGSPLVNVRSDASTGRENFDYAQTVHSFAKPGHYLVRAQHTTASGAAITARLHVHVEDAPLPKAAGRAPTAFDITVAAGGHDRNNVPIRVPFDGDRIGVEKVASVILTGTDGKAVPAQWTGPSLFAGDKRELHFILPHLAAGESLRLVATLFPHTPGASHASAKTDGFKWHDHPGDHVDLVLGSRPVLTYYYHPLDETSPASRVQTYKVFHNVYSPRGDRLITNGLPNDPKIHSPHHRGIFYGFNRISYGDGRTADLWHCTDGAYQEHERFLALEAGPVLARHRMVIRWHGPDQKPFAEEERELTAYNVAGGRLFEFASRMKSLAGPVRLDGDPQHAGFQFRAHNDVDAKTSHETIYVRTDGVGQPGETRNWDPQTRQGPVNLPWNAMSFVLGDQRYTVAYLDHPRNPKEARFSERAFGRFGSYFEYTIDEVQALNVNYRLWLQDGLMNPEEVAVLSGSFIEPVEFTLKPR
jgi:hypothetical protein